MINFKTDIKSLWSRTELNPSHSNNQGKTRTTNTQSSFTQTKRTITEKKRMEDINFNNEETKKWLDELDRQVIANIGKINFTVDDLATYMGISKRHLYRLINERIGETPHSYLKNYRLNYAKELLETKQVNSVKAAAYSTGFPNTVYFSRQFKATFGYLPSDLL